MKIKSLLHIFYPNRCAACGEVIKIGGLFCKRCDGLIPKLLVTGEICIYCGDDKKSCSCGKKKTWYSGFCAPFYFDPPASDMAYAIKTKARRNSLEYAGGLISLCVTKHFPDVKFDFVAAVPMYGTQKIKKGFNQAELLAKKVAEHLDLLYNKNILKKIKKTKTQHFLSPKERVGNVINAYKCMSDVTKKTILLIDDVKTTGSTFDECAKTLRFAGADEVYCASVTLSKPMREKM